MSQPIEPWSPYALARSLSSHGRVPLTGAFADLVEFATDIYPDEIYDILNAPPQDGENCASRHQIEMQAQILAREFVHGRIATFVRPLQGGDVEPLGMDKWEIDDPLPRFATGAMDPERWTDPAAPVTHRLFVDKAQFDRWLVTLRPPGPLTDEEIEAVIDPQVRAARAIGSPDGARNQDNISSQSPLLQQQPDRSQLLTLREVEKLTTRKKSTIYALEKQGKFPSRQKLGASTRWDRGEVEAWLSEQLNSPS